MLRLMSAPLPTTNESDVPPAVSCVWCGATDAEPCCVGPTPSLAVAPHWEQDGPWLGRLWRTAELSSLYPAQLFGTLQPVGAARALVFALLAELLALGSLLVLGLSLIAALSPSTVLGWLHDRTTLIHLALAWLTLAAVMVLLHAIWGLALELAVRLTGAPSDERRGFRFGMYACGWDLVTSPAGLFLALIHRGPAHALACFAAGTRVPRSALHAYLDQARQFDPITRRRALLGAVLVTGATLLLLVAAGLRALLPMMLGEVT